MSPTTAGAEESNTSSDVAPNAHHIIWGSTGTNLRRKLNGRYGAFKPECS
jgi:hypothetical protein